MFPLSFPLGTLGLEPRPEPEIQVPIAVRAFGVEDFEMFSLKTLSTRKYLY